MLRKALGMSRNSSESLPLPLSLFASLHVTACRCIGDCVSLYRGLRVTVSGTAGRHLENEEALEPGVSGEQPSTDKDKDKDSAVVPAASGRRRRGKAAESSDGAGPSTSAGGGAAAAATGGTGAYGSAEDGAGPGPSSAAAAGGGSAAPRARAGSLRSEEDDFDAALHSSELQPLAKALGGEAAAVASAPLRRAASPSPEAEEGERRAAGEAGAEGDAARGSKRQKVHASEAGVAAAEAGAAAADAEAGGGAAGATAPAAGLSSEIAAAADAERRAAAAAVAAPSAAADDEDDDEELSDHLSDVDDDDIGCYLATSEEASVRESLWVEMNKDWIEKQELKRKEAEEAAKDPSKAGSDKTKRKYNRKVRAHRGWLGGV